MVVIYNSRSINFSQSLSKDEEDELIKFKGDSILLGANAMLTPLKGFDMVLRKSATLYIDGDALPDVARIAGGTVAALGLEWRIVAGTKARNPDGTVNYTRLELA